MDSSPLSGALARSFSGESAAGGGHSSPPVRRLSCSAESVLGGEGAPPPALSEPSGISATADGGLLVVDSGNHRVLFFAPGSGPVVVAGGQSRGSGACQLDGPRDVAAAPDGGFFVADSGNNRVQRFARGTVKGVTVAGGRRRGSGPTQLDWPSSVAVTADGSVLVADSGNHRVQRFAKGATRGVTVAGGQGRGDRLCQLSGPLHVETLADGDFLVADTLNHRVLRFSRGCQDGMVVAGGKGKGSALWQLDGPRGVAATADRGFLVADSKNDRLLHLPAAASQPDGAAGGPLGTVVAGVQGRGNGPRQLHWPAGVAVSPGGGFFVADSKNCRLLHFSKGSIDSELVAGSSPRAARTLSIQLDLVSGVAEIPNGDVVAVDSKNNSTVSVRQPAFTRASSSDVCGEEREDIEEESPFSIMGLAQCAAAVVAEREKASSPRTMPAFDTLVAELRATNPLPIAEPPSCSGGAAQTREMLRVLQDRVKREGARVAPMRDQARDSHVAALKLERASLLQRAQCQTDAKLPVAIDECDASVFNLEKALNETGAGVSMAHLTEPISADNAVALYDNHLCLVKGNHVLRETNTAAFCFLAWFDALLQQWRGRAEIAAAVSNDLTILAMLLEGLTSPTTWHDAWRALRAELRLHCGSAQDASFPGPALIAAGLHELARRRSALDGLRHTQAMLAAIDEELEFLAAGSRAVAECRQLLGVARTASEMLQDLAKTLRQAQRAARRAAEDHEDDPSDAGLHPAAVAKEEAARSAKAALQRRQREVWQLTGRLCELSEVHCPEVAAQVSSLLSLGRLEVLSLSTDELTALRHVVVDRRSEDYDLGAVLSQLGARHEVRFALHGGAACVLKRVALAGEPDVKLFWKEVSLHVRLRHPLVVPLEASFVDGQAGYFQFPRFEHDLASVAISSLAALLTILRDAATVTEFMHCSNVLHGDIKPQNFLVTAEGRLLVCDFEFVRTPTLGSASTTMVTRVGGTVSFLSPEMCFEDRVTRNPIKQVTKEADVFALGVTFQQVLHRCRSGCLLGFYEITETLDELALRMTSPNPKKRPTAFDIARDPVLLHPWGLEESRHQDEWDALQARVESARDLAERIERDREIVSREAAEIARRDAQFRSVCLEMGDQEVVKFEEDIHQRQQLHVDARQRLQANELKLRAQQAALDGAKADLARLQPAWRLPQHWGPAPPAGGRRFASIVAVSEVERDALAAVLRPGGPLGGRKLRHGGGLRGGGGGGGGFQLEAAWRIENRRMFAKYTAERARLGDAAEALRMAGVPSAHVTVRSAFAAAASRLPASLDASVNEVYLSHGTEPDAVLRIIKDGCNERLSGGLFGQGTYFAEDVAKNDKYVLPDSKHDQRPELHGELYGRPPERPPREVFYVFLCRVALGHFARTRDARTNMDSGGALWSRDKVELAPVPGSSPPELHHALLAELGVLIHRYREFIVFHGDRIYPEYLIAYSRT